MWQPWHYRTTIYNHWRTRSKRRQSILWYQQREPCRQQWNGSFWLVCVVLLVVGKDREIVSWPPFVIFMPYVMRCVFPGGSGTTTGETTIHHIEGVVDPVADAQVVNLELLYAAAIGKEGLERETLIEVEQKLSLGIPARDAGLHTNAQFAIKSIGLLTLKPVLYLVLLQRG